MKTKTKFIVVAVILAIVAFGLGRVIWPDVPTMSMNTPTGVQLPLFIFLSALESVAFGIGVAFAFFGYKYVKAVMPENKKGTALSFIALIWMLVSWWPHDNMHRTNHGNDLWGLLRIEYLFHLTLIIATFILAYFFWKIVKKLSR